MLFTILLFTDLGRMVPGNDVMSAIVSLFIEVFSNGIFIFSLIIFLLFYMMFTTNCYSISDDRDDHCSNFWCFILFLYEISAIMIEPFASNVLQKRMHLHAYRSLSWYITVKLSNQTVFCITYIVLSFWISYFCNTLAVWGTPLLADEYDSHTCLFSDICVINHINGDTLKFFRETMWSSFGLINVMKECTGSFLWDIVSFFFSVLPLWW